jgi:hypothetical protein
MSDFRPYIDNTDESMEMWKLVEERASKTGTSMRRIALSIQFRKIKPVPGAPIGDYFAKLVQIKNQLAGTSQAISDDNLKAEIFAALPPEFEVTSKI